MKELNIFTARPGMTVIVTDTFPMCGLPVNKELLGKIGVITSDVYGSGSFVNVFFSPNHIENISLTNLSLLEDHDNVK